MKNSCFLQFRKFDELIRQFQVKQIHLTENQRNVFYKSFIGIHCCNKSLEECDEVYEVKLRK